MLRKWLAALLIAVLALTGTALADAKVTVLGTGTVLMDADRATIRVGVRELAEDVIAAQSSVNARIEAIVAALEALGVGEDALSTDTISIYPNYEYSGETERIAGYSAYNALSVTIQDIDNVGKIIDAAFEAGANTLDSVTFSASDTAEANHQALALAVKDAMEKAGVLAEAAGMTLGGIESIRESGGYSYSTPVKFARTEAAMDTATRVMASRLEVSATVEVEFELK